MFSHSILQERPMMSASLSLQDLLDDRYASSLSEYLSLSVTRLHGKTRISFTTTGSEPVTYSTVVPSVAGVDLQTLVFVAQRERRGDY